MKITFLGTGDAFGFDLRHNSAFLEFGGTNLFIDFPATNRKALRELGKELNVVENVYITHLHEDHINGIQQLAYYQEIVNAKKPNLYIHASLIDELWDTVKSGLGKTTKGRKYLENYFNIHLIEDEFEINGQEFKLVKTNHVPEMNSYGIIAKDYFYFSGDANVDKDVLEEIGENVKTIFHDCHLWDLDIASHANLEDIKELPQEVKNKVVLMHFHDGYADESMRLKFEEREKIQLARELKAYTFGGN